LELTLNTPLTNELLEEVHATAEQVRLLDDDNGTGAWELMQELVEKLAIDVDDVQEDQEDGDSAVPVVCSIASELVCLLLSSSDNFDQWGVPQF
jgi:hypothetical protein